MVCQEVVGFMIRKLIGLVGLVEGSVVRLSEFSGPIAPVQVGGTQLWVSLAMGRPESSLWTPDSCPPEIKCLAGHSDPMTLSLTFGGFEARVRVGLLADAPGSPRNRDVAGELGLSWRGPLARAGMMTFSDRGGERVVAMEQRRRVPEGTLVTLLVLEDSPAWSAEGRASLRGNSVRSSARVTFDMASADVVLPKSNEPLLTYPTGLTGFRGIVRGDRLYRKCSARRLTDPEAFVVNIKGGTGHFAVPIIWLSDIYIIVKGQMFCPLALRFHSNSDVVIGASLLRTFDVSLNAGARYVHIRSRGREVWSHPARLHVPRLTMYDPDFCGADQRELRCEWRQVDRNAKGQYLLHHKTAMEIAFVPIKAVELRIDGVTGYWFSHPSISTDSDGTITVTARRDPKGTYEVFASDDKLVSIAFSRPARDTSLTSVAEKRGKCGVCKHHLAHGDEAAEQVDTCRHRFHSSCLGDHLDSGSKVCPVCGEMAVRPHDHIDEMALHY